MAEPKQKREPEKWDLDRERALFYAALNDPANHSMYRDVLGPNVGLEKFLMAARDAVETQSKLLTPSWRASLMFSIKKAAQQGLRPDGKQGALVPRWNSEAKSMNVCWQPMIQGVLYLGRRAGVLKDITAEIVLAGEPFRFMRGDEPKIVHEWLPDVREKAYALLRPPVRAQQARDPNEPPPDDEEMGGPDLIGFWDLVVAAYCIVVGPDGSRTRRAMTRSRLLLLQDFSKASAGPWRSVWLDEMIVKSAAHFTMKHVDTMPNDEEQARRFREALDADMDAELSDLDDDEVDARAVKSAPTLPSLSAPNPMDKLSTLEGMGLKAREKVAVGGNDKPANDEKPASQAASPGNKAAMEKTFLERAAISLDSVQNGEKWLKVLDAVYAQAASLDDLGGIRQIRSFQAAVENPDLPKKVRAKIEAMQAAAGKRLMPQFELDTEEQVTHDLKGAGVSHNVAEAVAGVAEALVAEKPEDEPEEDDFGGWPGPKP